MLLRDEETKLRRRSVIVPGKGEIMSKKSES